MSSTLTYIWHDCFIYKSDSCIIIFDYWENPNQHDDSEFETYLKHISRRSSGADIPVYVLVSHHHKDHFNRKIFSWATAIPKIHYIISKDTERAVKYLFKEDGTYNGNLRVSRDRVTVLKPGESFADSIVRIHAFGSTDIGNSYVVSVDSHRMFHAGDLNAWIWKDESTAAEVNAAIRDYEDKLSEISEYFTAFDCVMFPVDARIGRDWWEGAFRFVHKFKVKLFVPMHFCLYASYTQRLEFERKATFFATYANPEYGYYCALTEPYETLVLSK